MGSSSRLQVQPGDLHSLLLIFDQVEPVIQLIDHPIKILRVITRAMSLQQQPANREMGASSIL